ncbi:hypothetical protein NUW58_g9390 [Xylaria curta]|uniref:Uncharacterized protein n=1 Tax=Xylaria curta TaxID=42375 RepID=A0ACC1MY17_9PEZI|nr:hypothetical protein NUW58_g9390 [Xylaria curta]
MLPDVRWRAELKVLLGEESEEARNSSDESLSEDANTMVGSGAELDWTRSIVSGESETADDGNNDGNNDVNSNGNKGDNTSGKEILAHSVSQGLEVLGLRVPTDSIFWPQARNPRLGERNDYECKVDNGRDGGFEYDADRESVNDDSMYDSDETHDPSLEPAPLSLPSRNAPRRREARSSFLSSGRRHAQIFPYKIVQKEYVQLNFAVLVDEDTNEDPLPRFLLQHADGYSVGREASEADGGEDEADRGEEEVYENDGLAWATWARVEQLPMDEALRRVVLEGLAWMESLTVESF